MSVEFLDIPKESIPTASIPMEQSIVPRLDALDDSIAILNNGRLATLAVIALTSANYLAHGSGRTDVFNSHAHLGLIESFNNPLGITAVLGGITLHRAKVGLSGYRAHLAAKFFRETGRHPDYE